MKFVADENLDRSVIDKLREAGHEVISVAEMDPGIPDEFVLETANSQLAMLITEDKDFGELVFRRKLVHQGVILVRLAGLPVATKANLLVATVAGHWTELPGAFVVVSPLTIRIRRRDTAEGGLDTPNGRHEI
jgi:predicted nuclease of predicted toxin-antitoxin system